jgi:EAL domain-containing protein (putative c-di-GMP-specific phosphodiesterase class I)
VVIFESRSSARVAAVACANRTPGTPNAELGADLTARIAERRDHEAWIEPLRSPFARSLGAASPGTGVNAHLIVPLLHDQMLLGALIVGGADVSGMDLLPQVPAVTEVAALAMSLVVPHMVETLAARVARMRIEGIIATSAFETVFQPIVDLETGTAVGFEGLSRFDGGDDPAELFAAAAACGAGHALERATLRATLVAARDLPADAWVSLNVSPTLALAGETLAGLLADQPRSIVVELTEHSPIADYGALREGLASLGPSIRVAVDGTGVGAANLRHLVELQPDFVKLDDSLVRCIDEDATRQALVVGLGAFARMSGRDLIAKGVETLPERDTLARLGVRLAQGYLLGGPAPAAAWARNGLAEP